jgi:hypothetical protein
MPASILFFNACKKNGNDGATKPLRIKTVTNGGVITYTYDAQYRLVKAEADQGFYKEEYLYEPGKITWILTEPSQTYKAFYTIDSKGYVKSKQFENDSEITYYEYNDNGYPVRSYDNKVPVAETNYYYNSGTGLLDSMRSSSGNQWNSTSVFLFNSEKTSTISDENYGRGFWGNFSKHPVKSVAVRRPNGNAVTVSVTSYTYAYDSKNQVISRSFTTSGGQSGTETYTYY